MLKILLDLVGGPIVDTILGKISGIATAYINKQVTEEELRAKVKQALVESFTEVEKAHAASLTQTYDSFMRATAQNQLMQVVWGAVTLSQLFVLLWHQVGIPVFVFLVGRPFPSSGATVDWAYALLALCLGGGAVALRTGPGADAIGSRLRGLVKQ